MIYYPLATLMTAGIQDILLISTPLDTPRFEALLGDGSRWGVTISYKVQPEPKGIAQAFLVGEEFIDNQPVCLILGDNIFYGKMNLDRIVSEFTNGARVFGYQVNDPERYGVVAFDANGTVLSIEENHSARNRIMPCPVCICTTTISFRWPKPLNLQFVASWRSPI